MISDKEKHDLNCVYNLTTFEILLKPYNAATNIVLYAINDNG